MHIYLNSNVVQLWYKIKIEKSCWIFLEIVTVFNWMKAKRVLIFSIEKWNKHCCLVNKIGREFILSMYNFVSIQSNSLIFSVAHVRLECKTKVYFSWALAIVVSARYIAGNRNWVSDITRFIEVSAAMC